MGLVCRRCGWVIGALVVAMAAARVAAGDPPDTAPDWAHLRQQLGDPDFARREAGQRELAKIPLKYYDQLAAQVRAERDMEVQLRLDRQLDALDLERVLHQPPISIDLADAPLPAVTEALNRALSKDAPLLRPGLGGRERFTIHAQELPFWEIVQQLHAQHPLSFVSSDGLRFVSSVGGMNGLGVVGPIAAVGNVTRVNRAVAGLPGRMEAAWMISGCMMTDPRLSLARFSDVRLVEIRDHEGLSLLTNADSIRSPVQSGGNSVWRFSVMIPRPAGAGPSLALVRGEAAMTVVTRQEHIVLEDVPGQNSRVVNLPQGSLTFARATLSDGSTRISARFAQVQQQLQRLQQAQLQAQAQARAAQELVLMQQLQLLTTQVQALHQAGDDAGAVRLDAQVAAIRRAIGQLQPPLGGLAVGPEAVHPSPSSFPVIFEVIAGDGVILTQAMNGNSMSVQIPPQAVPLKVVLRYPTRLQEAMVPFELRDLRLP